MSSSDHGLEAGAAESVDSESRSGDGDASLESHVASEVGSIGGGLEEGEGGGADVCR